MDNVIRIGNTIHRKTGIWAQQIHKFLRYLHDQGFHSVPEPFGFDKEGREILSFVEGVTFDYPLSEKARSMSVLLSSAKLLRAYHDVSVNFLNLDTSNNWMFPSREPQEVICHNDFAHYNIVFQEEQAIGIIDFDTAHPGPRKWDIAYALYRFAPFTSKDNEDGFGNIEDQTSRARLFCQTYGLPKEDRAEIANLMIERLQALIDFLIKSAYEGDKKYELNFQAGHHIRYMKDLEYIKSNKLAIYNRL
ncbi:MAG: aminoglycoside phosphotransferase family protein [Parachlamydiaceae bacterium]|nr:aminoglycoside phosphotransferase family protein [Parachlamydiaceae bacterium]